MWDGSRAPPQSSRLGWPEIHPSRSSRHSLERCLRRIHRWCPPGCLFLVLEVQMTRFGRSLLVAIVALGLCIGQALSDPVFVGSWEVDQGPFWIPAPPTYSGQEAAAHLFGGAPGDYF